VCSVNRPALEDIHIRTLVVSGIPKDLNLNKLIKSIQDANFTDKYNHNNGRGAIQTIQFNAEDHQLLITYLNREGFFLI
jgi:hypothetical protein